MYQKLIIVALLLATAFGLKAKERNHALGLGGGISSGFEYRYFLNDQNSLKFLLSSRNKGLQLHGLYEFHEKGIFDFPKPYVDFWGKNYVRVQPFDFAFTVKLHF